MDGFFLADYGIWLRWIHYVAGVTWIGLLWFFNYINGPFTKSLDADVVPKVVPQLMPRCLWWFRWGAAFTWLSGVLLAIHLGKSQDPDGSFMSWMTGENRGRWIGLGFVYGTVMAFNVWFIIWPRQKKIISAVVAGENPPEKAGWAKVATNASRINTYLSIPLLFAMGGAKHIPDYGASYPDFLTGAAIVTVIGFAVAWLFIHKVGPAVGKEFQR